MAELKCKDGTVIKISDETEAELRRAFEPKPKYKDCHLQCYVNKSSTFSISITTNGKAARITRDIVDVKAYIKALQEAVAYCEQHNLGM